MKRIQSACLIQTLHFQLKEGVPHEQAVAGVREEYAQYKTRLERNHTRYRIMREDPRMTDRLSLKSASSTTMPVAVPIWTEGKGGLLPEERRKTVHVRRG